MTKEKLTDGFYWVQYDERTAPFIAEYFEGSFDLVGSTKSCSLTDFKYIKKIDEPLSIAGSGIKIEGVGGE